MLSKIGSGATLKLFLDASASRLLKIQIWERETSNCHSYCLLCLDLIHTQVKLCWCWWWWWWWWWCTTHAVFTIRYCLYDCPKAKVVWSRMLRIREHLGVPESLSWRRTLLGYTEVLKIHKPIKITYPAAHRPKIHKLIKITSGSTPSSASAQQHDCNIRRRLELAASTYLWSLHSLADEILSVIVGNFQPMWSFSGFGVSSCLRPS